MKIREISLQNGIFVYKVGLSFTKWDFHLQRGTLALQTGLLLYISPNIIKIDFFVTYFLKIFIKQIIIINILFWHSAAII